MPRNINERLKSLENRRQGMDSRSYERLNADAKIEVIAKSLIGESWKKRATAQPYTRYALGAMQAVGAEYTRKSIETAERVDELLTQACDINTRRNEYVHGAYRVTPSQSRVELLTWVTAENRKSKHYELTESMLRADKHQISAFMGSAMGLFHPDREFPPSGLPDA